MEEIILNISKFLSHSVMINVYSNPQFAVEVFLALAVGMVNFLLVLEVNTMFSISSTSSKNQCLDTLKECPSKFSHFTGSFGHKDKSLMSAYKKLRKNSSLQTAWAQLHTEGDAFVKKLIREEEKPKLDKLELMLSVTPSEYIRRDKQKLLHASHLKDCLASLTQMLDKKLDDQSKETLLNNIDSMNDSLTALGFTDPGRQLQQNLNTVDDTLYNLMENIVLSSSLENPLPRLSYRTLMEKKYKFFEHMEAKPGNDLSESIKEKRSSMSEKDNKSRSFNSTTSSKPIEAVESSINSEEDELWWSSKRTPCTSQSDMQLDEDELFDQYNGTSIDRKVQPSVASVASAPSYSPCKKFSIESTLAFIMSEWERKDALKRICDDCKTKTDEIDRVLSITPSGYLHRERQLRDIKDNLLVNTDGTFFTMQSNLENVKDFFRDMMVKDPSKLWELDILNEDTLYDFLESVALPTRCNDLKVKRPRKKLRKFGRSCCVLKSVKSHDSVISKWFKSSHRNKKNRGDMWWPRFTHDKDSNNVVRAAPRTSFQLPSGDAVGKAVTEIQGVARREKQKRLVSSSTTIIDVRPTTRDQNVTTSIPRLDFRLLNPPPVFPEDNKVSSSENEGIWLPEPSTSLRRVPSPKNTGWGLFNFLKKGWNFGKRQLREKHHVGPKKHLRFVTSVRSTRSSVSVMDRSSGNLKKPAPRTCMRSSLKKSSPNKKKVVKNVRF